MQIKDGLCSVTNGSPTVIGNVDADWNGVVSGDIFTLQGSGVWYQVSSRAFVTDHWELTLSSNYGGSTASGQSYAITKDFTTVHSFPVPNRGDVETASIVKRALNMIDGKLMGVTAVDITAGAATFPKCVKVTLPGVGDAWIPYRTTAP